MSDKQYPAGEQNFRTGADAAKAPDADVDATDAARDLAAAEGINLADVEGTGEGGRITKGDVQDAVDAKNG